MTAQFVLLAVTDLISSKIMTASNNHRKKNESCVTQVNTVYPAKGKFILAWISPSEINTVYCVNMYVTASY